jgi:hypothetical protein
MRIYWIGKDKPPKVPQGFKNVGENVFETRDSHEARELGAQDARWSLSPRATPRRDLEHDPNLALKEEQAEEAGGPPAPKRTRKQPATAPAGAATTTDDDDEDEDDGDE